MEWGSRGCLPPRRAGRTWVPRSCASRSIAIASSSCLPRLSSCRSYGGCGSRATCFAPCQRPCSGSPASRSLAWAATSSPGCPTTSMRSSGWRTCISSRMRSRSCPTRSAHSRDYVGSSSRRTLCTSSHARSPTCGLSSHSGSRATRSPLSHNSCARSTT